MNGTHFRRQVAIGTYVVDFACLSHRLVVELDGGHRNIDDVKRHDAHRTSEIKAHGFRVLRFWNNDAMADPSAVVATITTPTPGPSPQGRGEIAPERSHASL